MADVIIFPPVLGIGPGVLDAAERLRRARHRVHVADLYDGRTFADYPPAIAHAEEEIGIPALLERADASAAAVPDGFVVLGFSLGCVAAVHVATRRAVTGVVMVAGAVPVSMLPGDARWPRGVPAQSHATVGDPWRTEDEIEATVRDVRAGGGTIEVVDHPGAGHLFSDPGRPDEYDPVATEVLWSRVLPFVASCAPG